MCLHSQKKQKKEKALLTADVDCNNCIASCWQLQRFMCMVLLIIIMFNIDRKDETFSYDAPN